MDEFVRRPGRQRIKLPNDPVPTAPGKRIAVMGGDHEPVKQSNIMPLSVRPQLSQQRPKPEPEKAMIEIPEPATPPDEVKPARDTGNQPPVTPPKMKRRFRFKPRKPRNKKEWIIAIAAAVVLLGLIGAALYWFVLKPDPAPKPVTRKPVIKKEEPKPEPILSTLTGMPVSDKSVNSKQVTAVMIENSPDARPQSGLKDAGIVFEAVAEGGITRFNALYQDTAPDYIGPIRSIRPYYIDWFLPFDAAIAHVGGSPQGLADIRSLGAKDLDQFANSGAYTRITDRYAPHNVYSSIAKLNELQAAKGFNTSTYTGFMRKKEAKSATPTAKSIDLNISSFLYNAHYDYDAGSNSYLRSEGGEAHKDERSGAQLSPKVVVAIVMGRGIDPDGQHTAYQSVGSGKMYVFQDGVVTEGTWAKDARNSQWRFTDAASKPIAFNPGQTWITIVDSADDVIHKP